MDVVCNRMFTVEVRTLVLSRAGAKVVTKSVQTVPRKLHHDGDSDSDEDHERPRTGGKDSEVRMSYALRQYPFTPRLGVRRLACAREQPATKVLASNHATTVSMTRGRPATTLWDDDWVLWLNFGMAGQAVATSSWHGHAGCFVVGVGAAKSTQCDQTDADREEDGYLADDTTG